MKLIVCVLLALHIALVSGAALAACKKEAAKVAACKKENAALERENEELRKEIAKLEEECGSDGTDNVDWRAELAKKDKVIATLTSEVGTLRATIVKLNAQIARLQKQYDACAKKCKELGIVLKK